MKLQDKYFGSTVLIVLGVLLFIVDIVSVASGTETTRGGGLIIGLPIVFGALAYRSAKRRRLLTTTSSIVKRMFEIIYLSLSVLPIVYMGVLLDKRASQEFISQNPHIILWVGILIAYFVVLVVGKRNDTLGNKG